MRLPVPNTITLLIVAAAALLLLLLVQAYSSLAASRDRLGESRERVEQLSVELGAATERLAAEETKVESLTGELSTANANLSSANAENASLRAEIKATSEQLTARTNENKTLTADLLETTKELGSKTTENEGLVSDLDRVTSLLDNKSADYDSLIEEVGTLETLRADRDTLLGEIETLNSSIKELQAIRRPLIVQSTTVGFRCTGSMEPKITCLDSATWLHNFDPEDVSVGTVIVFTPVPECELGTGTLSHRVVDIRKDEGTYYYWPKGDANPNADGCWIPHTNVYGYMIELHKDTHPGYSDLRNRVNAAQAYRDETLATYKAAEEAYNRRYQEFCGHDPDACTLDQAGVAELDRLYDEFIRLFNIHQEAYDAWNVVYQEAWNTY